MKYSLQCMESCAPIALFVYNRCTHIVEVLEALKKNEEISSTDLYIFSDGARDECDKQNVGAVRKVICELSGFRSIKIIERERNFGLAESIIDGINYVLKEHEALIVLEDDVVVDNSFLKYMNHCLRSYSKISNVGHVSAYMYPISLKSKDGLVFLDFPMSWGWATWGRAWEYFQKDGQFLFNELVVRGLAKRFDGSGPGGNLKMLKNQIHNKNNSWYIRWHASLFLNGMLTVAPASSFVKNTGIDGTGVHCEKWYINPFSVKSVSNNIQFIFSLPCQISIFNKFKFKVFFTKYKILRVLNYILRKFAHFL